LVIQVKYFGRHKGGTIRDGVIVGVEVRAHDLTAKPSHDQPLWSCDTDAVIMAMDAADGI
jgi:hypothetical protein